MKLKADLHTHSQENSSEKIEYSALELIDKARQCGFDVLSITNHDVLTYNGYLRDYARERGILLIPGVEATVEGKHVLLYNVKDYSSFPIRSFSDLKQFKAENNLVVAPHPFFPMPPALMLKLYEHIRLFDALEYCRFYIRFLNFNAKMLAAAKQYDLPIIGNSDTHCLIQFNTTYSLIEAEKDVDAVIQAIKQKKVDVMTRPFSVLSSVRLLWLFFFKNPNNIYRTMLHCLKGIRCNPSIR